MRTKTNAGVLIRVEAGGQPLLYVAERTEQTEVGNLRLWLKGTDGKPGRELVVHRRCPVLRQALDDEEDVEAAIRRFARGAAVVR